MYPPESLNATHVSNVTDCAVREWLLFMAQLPAAPSSARVTLWRQLKAAGATSLLTGAWVLPNGETNAGLLTRLAETALAQGASAAVFVSHAVAGVGSEEIIARFHADRAREFDEFATRTDAFLAEIDRETAADKFTFAELEEIEDDLAKLKRWLEKIIARDFFPDERQERAAETLARCRTASQTFAETVYERGGASIASPE